MNAVCMWVIDFKGRQDVESLLCVQQPDVIEENEFLEKKSSRLRPDQRGD